MKLGGKLSDYTLISGSTAIFADGTEILSQAQLTINKTGPTAGQARRPVLQPQISSI